MRYLSCETNIDSFGNFFFFFSKEKFQITLKNYRDDLYYYFFMNVECMVFSLVLELSNYGYSIWIFFFLRLQC